jgi:hypothetical protein
MAVLFCLSYAFLLRVPSEGLPLRIGPPIESWRVSHPDTPWIVVGAECIRIDFWRRKNLPNGSVLVRKCWCVLNPETCPMHVAGAWLKGFAQGEAPFAGISASDFNSELRSRGSVLGVRSSELLCSRSFRRGHARDLVDRGARIGEILAAGQWRSAAFLEYMDHEKLECDAVIEAHLAQSDHE